MIHTLEKVHIYNVNIHIAFEAFYSPKIMDDSDIFKNKPNPNIGRIGNQNSKFLDIGNPKIIRTFQKPYWLFSSKIIIVGRKILTLVLGPFGLNFIQYKHLIIWKISGFIIEMKTKISDNSRKRELSWQVGTFPCLIVRLQDTGKRL